VTDLAGSLIVWLRTQPAMAGVTIVGRVPRTYPDKLVVIKRGGGIWDWPVVDTPTIEVEVWALTETAAYELAGDVRALIHSLQGGAINNVAVYRVDEFSGPAWLPDPNTDKPRFVTTYSIRHREHLPVP
jgi:hypothetical protein